MIYKISTYEPIHLKLYEFKLLSLFNIKSVSQEQVQITELFAFLPDPGVSGVRSMGPGVSTRALVETLLM